MRQRYVVVFALHLQGHHLRKARLIRGFSSEKSRRPRSILPLPQNLRLPFLLVLENTHVLLTLFTSARLTIAPGPDVAARLIVAKVTALGGRARFEVVLAQDCSIVN